MNLTQIHPDLIQKFWPLAEPFLSRALAFGDGKYNVDQLKVLVQRQEQALLLAVADGEVVGAATVTFINYPNARVAFITAVGGRLVSSQEVFNQLEQFCAQNGATEIEGWARESVARLWRQKFGFDQPCVIVRKKL